MQAIGNEELERRFDEAEDITDYMDMSTARRPNQERLDEEDEKATRRLVEAYAYANK